MQPSAAPLLELKGLSKSFPGVKALDQVDLTARSGEVLALMGENGAGKSTLIKVLTGVFPKDGGEARLEGRTIHPRTPLEAQNLGINTVYQEVNLIPRLSVAENICLGRQPTSFGRVRWAECRRRARAALDRLGLDLDVTAPLDQYSTALQQMVAVARALDQRSRLLILDEPTSSLDEGEVDKLFDVLRLLKAGGLGIIFVTHFLDQVFRLADRITVLRNGRAVGTYEAAALSRLRLISLMMGRDLSESDLARSHPPAGARAGAPLLELEDATGPGLPHPVSLRIHAGEVLGLGGLLGSGRTETARLLFGLQPLARGSLKIRGRPRRFKSCLGAIREKMGFCPEDRKAEGIIPNLSVRENIILALQARRGWLRALSAREQEELAGRLIADLRIATPNGGQPIRLLSGGNQQKAILARWLASRPALLILDEPTRGVDAGAKLEIEKLVAQLAAEGMGLLFISSDVEETARNSHRVVILRDRRVAAELRGDEIREENIMRAIAEKPKG